MLTFTNPHPFAVKVDRAEDCPEANLHTPQPEGYVDRSEWANRMLVTHFQQRCPVCGFWMIWKPREAQRTISELTSIFPGVRITKTELEKLRAFYVRLGRVCSEIDGAVLASEATRTAKTWRSSFAWRLGIALGGR